jgi:2-polyprenyl-6-hydroxyphenyl methylase/3-demethylubiquinone-9 3-methyltransferase
MFFQKKMTISEARFGFGKNWKHFLEIVNDARISSAEKSLKEMLQINDLNGKRFLDIGSGSGLFSLAARRLGAHVYSFDFDPESVACTRQLKEQYSACDGEWVIEEGSVLDVGYLRSLGKFDVVYSWGVLHHTGSMWTALQNAAFPVTRGGKLFIAIYNDQGWISRYWMMVKRIYNKNVPFRMGLILFHFPYLFGMRYIIRLLTGRFKEERGMSLWYDMIDWLGGYPFEVAKPEEILALYVRLGFVLEKLKTCRGRHGCNEFVFIKRE